MTPLFSSRDVSLQNKAVTRHRTPCTPCARLFHDRDALQQARTLIEQCEYFRRLPELEDTEVWSAAA